MRAGNVQETFEDRKRAGNVQDTSRKRARNVVETLRKRSRKLLKAFSGNVLETFFRKLLKNVWEVFWTH